MTTRRWSRPCLLRGKTSEPFHSPPGVYIVFAVETNQGAKNEGERGLEWAIVGESGSRNREQIEEEGKHGETDGNAGDNLVDEEEVVGERVTEEQESGLEQER